MTANEADHWCPRCEGCGLLADTDGKEPWRQWMELPIHSSAGVVPRVVRPIPCPDCDGTGHGSSLQDAKRRLFGWLRRVEFACKLYPECPGQCPGCQKKARLDDAMKLIDELTRA